jgi:hypothetical protein
MDGNPWGIIDDVIINSIYLFSFRKDFFIGDCCPLGFRIGLKAYPSPRLEAINSPKNI